MYSYGFIENIYTCAGIFYILEVKQYIWMSGRCTKNTFIFISVLIMSTNGLIKVNPLPLGRNSQWIHKILLVSSFENKIRTVTNFAIPAAENFYENYSYLVQ